MQKEGKTRTILIFLKAVSTQKTGQLQDLPSGSDCCISIQKALRHKPWSEPILPAKTYFESLGLRLSLPAAENLEFSHLLQDIRGPTR